MPSSLKTSATAHAARAQIQNASSATVLYQLKRNSLKTKQAPRRLAASIGDVG
jgi:hypothetical protein